jgi:P pilus assembly chaperone PapD
MRKNVVALLCAWCCCIPLASAQQNRMRVQLLPEIKHDMSPPLRDMSPGEYPSLPQEDHLPVFLGINPVGQKDPLIGQPPQNKLNINQGLNFDGLAARTSVVPDTNGSVGATQFVEWTNMLWAVYDKTNGSLLYGPSPGNSIWKGFGGLCELEEQADGVVIYDKAAGVWVFSRHAIGTSYYQCVAVSATNDATGSWYRYAFLLPNLFPDYPKISVWPDAYYLSINLQTSTFAPDGGYLCALDRNNMLAGANATAQCFQLSPTYNSLLPSDWDGPLPPPTGSPNYFVNLGTNSLNFWQFHVDWDNPNNTTFTGPISLPVSTFKQACNGGVCVPQGTTTQQLDSLGDRLMFRLAYRNFGDHESLVATHSVATGTGNTGIRWYEIRNPGGNPPTLYQQGTFAPDANFRWMPSIAMDGVGNIAVGYSVSSSTMHPAIRYTGRLATDALGTMQAENSIFEGTGSEVGANRWGDYTSMAIDPQDDCTFWHANQYFPSPNNDYTWHTRIASFSFNACTNPDPVTVAPTSLDFGNQAVNTTSPPQPVTLTNHQSVTLNISNVSVTGDFAQTNNCGSTLPPSSSCTFQVTFSPTQTGTRNGALTITDDASNSPQVVTLTGVGTTGSLTVTPTSLTFAGRAIGTKSSQQSVTVTNAGSSNVTMGSLAASANYNETDTCAGVTLLPGKSCKIGVTFSPSASGSISGVLTINDSAPTSPQLVSLTGSGFNPVVLSPPSVSFGAVAVGSTSAPVTVTISNQQSATLTFSYAASGDFSVVPGGSLPCNSNTIAAGSHCTLSVTFSPTFGGTIAGALTITHSALFSPQEITLSGSGSGAGGGPLAFTPTALGFSNVAAGTTSSAKTVTVTNKGTSAINISSLTASGNYSVSGSGTKPCGGALSAGASCQMAVTFSPTTPGTIVGSVTIANNSLFNPLVYNMQGTSVLPVTLSPPTLTFAAQTVGTNSNPQTVTLRNNYNTSLSISALAASGDYSIIQQGTNPCSTGIPVPAGASCTISVVFSPNATGTIPGAVTIIHSAPYSPQEITLSGTGK